MCKTSFDAGIRYSEKEVEGLKRRNTELRQSLRDIIAECPNPTLPYGVRIVEIATKAIE